MRVSSQNLFLRKNQIYEIFEEYSLKIQLEVWAARNHGIKILHEDFRIDSGRKHYWNLEIS